MISYLFVFGRTPNLAYQELISFFPDASLLTANVALLEVPDTNRLSPGSLLATLGGTVKIAEIIDEVPQYTATILEAVLAAAMSREKRIVFGISSYDPRITVDTHILADTKKTLETKGHAVRFVVGRDHEPLSSVVIVKQKLTEFIIAPRDRGMVVAKTVAVQDFESWNRRDYGRPYADPKSGMLPPKVARIAVNLAMRAIPAAAPGSRERKDWIPGQARNDKILLDPFCGMGTILAEGLLAGWRVIGSDQSKEVVEKAQKNLEWLMTPSGWKFFVSDATHVSEHLPKESIDAIVTEPFMGSTEIGAQRSDVRLQTPARSEKIKNIIRGLEKLYIGCLKDWHTVLRPGGSIVIALPAYTVVGRTYTVKKVIDSCENLGYTKRVGPIEYSRPQAVVRREFFVFQKI